MKTRSPITLTKKASGRYYLGLGADDFRWLKSAIALMATCPQLKDATVEEMAEMNTLRRINTVLQKPARGEA